MQEKNKWFSIFKKSANPQIRLICFPYAGGGSYIYRKWADYLPDFVEVYAVKLPGREDRLREQPFTRIEPLIEVLSENLREILDVKFALFGHSMGAILAFEFARLVGQKHGIRPTHIFVSGRRAPHLPETDKQTYNLPEDEFIAELKRLNGTPAEVLENYELLQLMIPILRADFSICQTYQPPSNEPVNFPITVLGGTKDSETSFDSLNEWKKQTTADFELNMIHGDHFFINTAKEILLSVISQKLQKQVFSQV